MKTLLDVAGKATIALMGACAVILGVGVAIAWACFVFSLLTDLVR